LSGTVKQRKACKSSLWAGGLLLLIIKSLSIRAILLAILNALQGGPEGEHRELILTYYVYAPGSKRCPYSNCLRQ